MTALSVLYVTLLAGASTGCGALLRVLRLRHSEPGGGEPGDREPGDREPRDREPRDREPRDRESRE